MFTVALVAAMIIAKRDELDQAKVSHPAIQIELAPEAAPPAPPARQPPPPQPPKPRLVKKMEPVREIAPEARPLMTETVQSPSVDAASGQPAAEAPAAPIPDRPAGTIEAQYAETLRTNIDARTVVPDSIEYRLRHPKGEARVDFTLDRGGVILTAAVARTSGSEILDRQAVRIVKAGHYPPFPDSAFRGESRHSFTVTLEFNT
jgi:periplasmic protein TonB